MYTRQINADTFLSSSGTRRQRQHFIFLQGAITQGTLETLMPANDHTNDCRICVCILDKSRVNKRAFRHSTLWRISCFSGFWKKWLKKRWWDHNLPLKKYVWWRKLWFIYIYIYQMLLSKVTYRAFRLYICIVSMCVPWESNPQPLRC